MKNKFSTRMNNQFPPGIYMSATKQLELLSPAKNLEFGIAAVNCGADAVYIGAPKYGARSAAGNSINDIEKLAGYAHKYWAKVYVTLNTLIYDEEINDIKKIISQLYSIGVDAIIFQDMALMQIDIPPIQLFASTQTHNYDIDRIKFLDSLGIKRIILARELSLQQIARIHANVNADLEFFVHGALCVSMSGQCYLSAAMMGRSANRGECAQPCRLKYTLVDSKGKTVIKDKHLLSLHDLNLSAYLNDLIKAGITSFKIEGRLKDIGYVKNITAYYRNKIDAIIENDNFLSKSSSGHSIIPFTPAPEKSFNRGFTSYYINGKNKNLSSIETPKSIGQFVGTVSEKRNNSFTISTTKNIVNGDGLCFFGADGQLEGMYVNKVESNTIYTDKLKSIQTGTKIYRNFDIAFENELKRQCLRKIKVEIKIRETQNGINISARDETNISVELNETVEIIEAVNKTIALENLKKQFSKSGDTIFEVDNVIIIIDKPFFMPVKLINQLRRKILSMLQEERLSRYFIEQRNLITSNEISAPDNLDYKWNVINKFAREFYTNRGATNIEDGLELQQDFSDKILMTCKYCIKDELGLCNPKIKDSFEEPFYLLNSNKKYKLFFNCNTCEMQLTLV